MICHYHRLEERERRCRHLNVWCVSFFPIKKWQSLNYLLYGFSYYNSPDSKHLTPGISLSPIPPSQQPWLSPVKLQRCPWVQRHRAISSKYRRVVFPATCFGVFFFAGALLFLSSFISQNQSTVAGNVNSFNSRLRKMDDRAILKQNPNNKPGNKETARPGGDSCHKGRSFSKQWVLLRLSCTWRPEDRSKRLFSLKEAGAAKGEATIWWSSGDRLWLCRRTATDIET